MPKFTKYSVNRIAIIVFAVIASFIQMAEFLFVLIFVIWFVSEGPLNRIVDRTADKHNDEDIIL